ncbi:hypothetical protein [Acinetobacter radioresistens]|uniref:hypothetical protein n=2 Tax=Acinetobacter radioresistens TaxID=40216 RepID=UPI000DAE16B9|nr:hypothetical protein [Acinetobacter radioresistens]AWV87039.1 hypothetical protein DOM24_10735 [Acinetobacter radioresistens]MCX0328912.1 hypothetical protein [Acinetobacter radioresistens]
MLLIISKSAVILFIISFSILVFHPKIKLPKHIDFLLMLSIIFGVALLVKDRYVASPAGTLFYTTVSVLFALFTRQIYLWGKGGARPKFFKWDKDDEHRSN